MSRPRRWATPAARLRRLRTSTRARPWTAARSSSPASRATVTSTRGGTYDSCCGTLRRAEAARCFCDRGVVNAVRSVIGEAGLEYFRSFARSKCGYALTEGDACGVAGSTTASSTLGEREVTTLQQQQPGQQLPQQPGVEEEEEEDYEATEFPPFPPEPGIPPAPTAPPLTDGANAPEFPPIPDSEPRDLPPVPAFPAFPQVPSMPPEPAPPPPADAARAPLRRRRSGRPEPRRSSPSHPPRRNPSAGTSTYPRRQVTRSGVNPRTCRASGTRSTTTRVTFNLDFSPTPWWRRD